MGKIIAIANRRGRVGKTTTAINLAAALTHSGKKTLLVDLDSAGSCAAGLGFTKQEAANNIFIKSNHILTIKKAILKTGIKNLDLLQIKRLPYLDEMKTGDLSANEHILKSVLKPVSANYNYVIMDCPPHHTGNINAALMTADTVLIPAAPGKFSAAAVRKIIFQINELRENYNPELKVAGIFLSNYKFNNSESFTLKKELFNEFPKLMLNTSIPHSAFVRNAFEIGEPLFIYKPDDRAAKAYTKLADELFERKSLFSTKRKV